MEKILVNSNDTIKQIDKIQFGVLSSKDIIKLSSIQIANSDLYNETKTEPVQYGPLDNRLGISEKGKVCQTCNKRIAECPGHFGYVKLDFPVFHIGFYKYIITILQCVCKECSRLLLPIKLRDDFLRRLKRKNITRGMKEKVCKNIIKECKKVKVCEYCQEVVKTVKKRPDNPLTLITQIDKKMLSKDIEMKDLIMSKYESAINYYKELEGIVENSYEELTPLKVFHIFQKIPEEDAFFFDMKSEFTRPVDLLVNHVLVPPVSIRPTVQVTFNVTNEDDLTIRIKDMIDLNKKLKQDVLEGHNTTRLIEEWYLLQATHSQYINSEAPGLPRNLLGNKAVRALCQRLKGKTGRFRGNLSGKRVDFTGRTVISPDPNLKIDQVGVPELMAKIMTFPQRVNSYNINELRKLVINGPDHHPGANYVETTSGSKIFLQYCSRKKVAEELKIGDIVERHLNNDDIVLFNRQPSLHRLSIMGFRVKVLPWRTLRFNECCCTPFNADFDGDEMNIHLPQTEEAKSEAMYLMGVKNNLISPRVAEPQIAATQDFLTTFFIITQRDFFIDRSHFFQYISYFSDANEKIEIPTPSILKPVELWTGKQLFNSLLRPNRKSRVLINLEIKERNYSEIGEFMCPNDGYVLIKRSELLTGNFCKKSIGSGSKSGVIFSLIKDNNKQIAAEVLSRIAKFSSRWIGNFGMTFGIKDVTPFQELLKEKSEMLKISYANCQDQISQYEKGIIALKPGCNAEQSLESNISGELNKIREKAGSVLNKKLPKTNPALIMAICGSKGSNINLCQMIACVGQQVVSGSRIPNGFSTRTLPHFEHFSKYPAAKGFVENSFYSGLRATEFFFHTMGGREGLVDTAVKTADTGYMQRRLVKALEDLTVQYDYSVTDRSGGIIQFIYGDDAIDPMNMDDGNKIVNLSKIFSNVKQCYPCYEGGKYLNSFEIQNIVRRELENNQYSKFTSEAFIQEINDFFKEIMERAEPNNKKGRYFLNEIAQVTEKQVEEFFKLLWNKYRKAMIVPGEAVGAVAAQSIGEPGTQMTLKTFHFAGVASMNITLGVPRIKEIINATKVISTPIITAKLVNEYDIISARIVKGRIENTKLKDILEYIKEVMTPEGCYLVLKLDMKTIDALKLEVKIEDIRNTIINIKPRKYDPKQITILSSNKIKVSPADCKENMFFLLQEYKRNLGNIIVCGIPTISRAIINKIEKDSKYNLLIEGTGLLEIMTTPGINPNYCTSNHIIEVNQVLGIEAARQTIIKEIKYTIGEHGIFVDSRHLQLAADIMTCQGDVLGITRFGISKMNESTLMLASFERTNDMLFDAAFHSKNDHTNGVSECIIIGKPIPLGTGLFKMYYDQKCHNKYKRMENKEEEDIVKRKYDFTQKPLITNYLNK